MKTILALSIGALTGISLGVIGCATTLTGRSHLSLISEEEANQMGAQAYQEMLSSPEVRPHVLTSGSDYARVDRITRKIVAIAREHEADFDWQWVVIDDPQTVNAFCLPGGKIAVYTGIMKVAENDDQLAAVIGHEIAHATNHHGVKRMSQAVVQNLAGDLGGGFLGLGESDKQIMLGAMGAVANTFDAYSRDDETESDVVGLYYLIRAGYDPNAAVKFWENMQKLGGSGDPEFLSTHPAHGTRIDDLRRAIEIYQTQGLDEMLKFEHYT